MTRLISKKKAIVIYLTVSIFLVFEMAVQVSPSIMASSLMHDLNIGTFALGIMSSVYFYTYTCMQIPSGLLFDRFRPRQVISASIVCCAVGVILFGCVHGFYLACLARLFMGLGSAFAFVSVLVVAADLFDKKYFPVLAGITQMLAALGAMAGQLPVSFIVNHVGWRATMLYLGIFGIILSLLVWYLLNYEKALSTKSNSNVHWLSSIKADLAIILSNKQNWVIAVYACLLWAPMSGFASLWGVPFLIHFDRLSMGDAAIASSMMWLGLAVGSPLLGVLSNLSVTKVALLWLSALVGLIAFGLVVEFHLSLMTLSVALFIAGAACSGQALSFALVRENNLLSVRSTAMAFNNMAVVISGALFQPFMGKIIEHYQKIDSSSAYQYACYLIFFAYVVGFAVAIFFVKAKRTRHDSIM